MKGKFFIATLRGAHIEMLQIDDKGKVVSDQSIFQDKYGRLRDVVQGPDGYLYVLTSNMDGRGSPLPDDDRILRIVPEFGPIVSLILVVSIASVLALSTKNVLKIK
ncbi:MAG: PQQ-dependent sugar dehydrogenase [Thaumarchaeota archaeon]|nr:PQQ-dependent sugar dehydrogenase [Nitrososphaerota archaeon]